MIGEPIEPIKVAGASGAVFEVIHPAEAEFWDKARNKYMKDFKFENIADLQDLDRVLVGELLSFRWGSWLVKDADYEGRSIVEDEAKLRKDRIEAEKETRILKEKMGLNRAKRQDSEQQATHEFLASLLRRAKEFGIMRDMQIAESINIMHELFTMAGIWRRGDEEERTHLKASSEEILAWVLDEAQPRYNEIDDAFRKNQKVWIKEVSP